MAFSVSEFRSKGIARGGARPNLFQTTLTNVPAGVSIPVGSSEGGWSFVCKIASIPASTVAAVEVPYFGRQVKVPGNRTFDNLSVTVINDEGFDVRNGLEHWMAKMNGHQSNVQSVNANDLLASMSVLHYGKEGENTTIGDGAWTFENIFPVSLGEIALDWGSNDTIEEYTVEFAYDYWSHGPRTN